MANINIAKSPANSAVLPFYGAAALFFVIGCILLLIHPGVFLGGYFDFHLLTIVHVFALGWLSMIIFGAGYQLLPVICEQDLYSERIAFCSFILLTIGVILLGTAFWYTPFFKGRFPLWGLFGGGAIILASLLFVFNVARTTRICKRYSVQKTFILTAALWLLLTTSLGFLLALNLRYAYISKNHLDLLKLHAHIGLAGWFLQLIIGVSVKLIPMFLLGKSNKDGLLKTAFILINTGLIAFLVDVLWVGFSDHVIIFLLMVFIGIICWVLYLRDVYKNRIRRPIDVTLRFSGLSFINLALSLGVLFMLLTGNFSSKWLMSYGILIFIGWISSLALGMTFKTLPFIVWNGHYKHLNGKGRIPLPKELYKDWLVRLQWWLFLGALYMLILGLILEQFYILQLGLSLLLATSLSYVINVIIILQHKTNFIHANPSTATTQ